MKKFLFTVLIILIIAVVGILFMRNAIATYLLEKGFKDLIGLKLTTNNINLGILETDIKVDGLTVYNPSGYTEKILAELPQIYIDYSLQDIIKMFLHFPQLSINISQINVEKDSSGNLNVDYIAKAPAFQSEDKKQKTTAQQDKEKKMEFLVDRMTLEIGTIRYLDNSKNPPLKKKISFNYSKTFKNITDSRVIVDSIVGAVVKKLIAEGVSVTVKSFLTNEKFVDALLKGDTETMKVEGAKELGGLGKELEQEMFKDDTGSHQQKSVSDVGKETIEKEIEKVLEKKE